MKSQTFNRLFFVTLIVKGLDGVLELLGSIILLFTSSSSIQHIVYRLTATELVEDPHDLLANAILTLGRGIGDARLFSSAYLFIHGAVKIAIVVFLIRENIKVYPWAISALAILTGYQVYLTIQHTSMGLVALTVLDAIIVGMAIHEYKLLKNKLHVQIDPPPQ